MNIRRAFSKLFPQKRKSHRHVYIWRCADLGPADWRFVDTTVANQIPYGMSDMTKEAIRSVPETNHKHSFKLQRKSLYGVSFSDCPGYGDVPLENRFE
jgi:hypothetical protein